MKTSRHATHRLFVHLIWTTRSRAPVLGDDFWTYARATLECLSDRGFRVLRCGGVDDHIHLLVACRPDVCVSDIVRRIKAMLSFWLRRHGSIPDFSWQEGFAAFSLSAAEMPTLIRYIEEQRHRHAKKQVVCEWECSEFRSRQ